MRPYEIAEWLCSKDSTGATDEQFAETFALIYMMLFKKPIPYIYDTDIVIKTMDTKELCNKLFSILDEIQYNSMCK